MIYATLKELDVFGDNLYGFDVGTLLEQLD
jgi:hypothetical protein